jgi:selenocysteine lyase/cysteine desulfurase
MRSYQDECEARPDEFIRYKYTSLLDKSREALAALFKVSAETLVFVPNATTGINTVLRGLTYQPDDYILFFAPIYGACEKTVAYITEMTPAKSIKIEYTYPVEDDWLVEEFKKTVQQVKSNGGRVKIALFDTITSNPGVRVPFERLTAACKEEGVLSCIDGAHSVGQLDLNLGTLDPDFYVSNCHKYVSL